MPTIREEIERFTDSPVFKGRFGLFVTSEGAYRELEDAGLPEDARLAERGYKSVAINGVPVIWMEDYTGSGFLPVDQELMNILARKG